MKKIIASLFALSLLAVAGTSFAHCSANVDDPQLSEIFTNYDA